MKKYELTSETLQYAGHTLHRIKALRDFGPIKVGELGGWIEKEENLSLFDNAWVFDDAKVFDDARVCDNAALFNNAAAFNNAMVSGYARICDNVMVSGYAMISGDARVCNNARVFDKARVCNNARVSGYAIVSGYARVFDKADVCGNAWICGDAKICGNADYIVFKNFWSSGRYFTWTRSNNKWSVGCFYGTGDELVKKAYADSEVSGREYERVVRYVESIFADKKKRSTNHPAKDIKKQII